MAFRCQLATLTSDPLATHQVIHNGFYTSMEALKGATYEELVDSGVRPVHAKLIISHLGSRTPMPNFGTPLPVRSSYAPARHTTPPHHAVAARPQPFGLPWR